MAFKFIEYHSKYLLGRLGKVLHLDMLYFAKGGFWLGLSYVVSALLYLLLAIAFTNLTSQEFYGQYQFITSVIFTLLIFSLPGFNTAVMQSVANGYDSSLARAVRFRFRWSLLGSFALLTAAGYFYFISPKDFWPLFILAAVFFPTFSFETYSSFLCGKKRFDVASKYQIISRLIIVLAIIAAVFLSKNLFVVVLVFLLSTALTSVFFYIKSRRIAQKSREDSGLFRFGSHLSIMEAFGIVSMHVDKLVLTYFLGFENLAIYSIALAFTDQVKGLLRLSVPLLVPKLANVEGSIYTYFKPKLALSFLISSAIAIAGFITAPWLVTFFFSEKYAPSVFYAQLLFIPVAFLLPAYILYACLQVKKKVNLLYRYNMVYSSLEILLFVVLIPYFGILGAVMSRMGIILFNVCYLLFLARKS